MGRMASKVAFFLQGKNFPTVQRHMVLHNQYCVIVNSDNLYVKGRYKDIRKLYRHHTGHPGGFQEYKMKEMIAMDSVDFVLIAIKIDVIG